MPDQAKKCLFKLFNRCITEEKIPDVWKESVITMIQKKSDDLSNPASYRPISITCCFARLFEKLILKRLSTHLQENNIILDQQSGFRSNRQTKDNLAFIVQKGLEAKNRGWKMINVYFDFQAAFDKIWHEGLLYKLVQINTPYYLIKAIQIFLANRSFKVKVGAELSSQRKIEVGVPQGGVLSPTLFSIFINDIPTRMNKNKEYTLLFADDLVLVALYKKKIESNRDIIEQIYDRA